MKSIGGYLELQLNQGEAYYPEMLKLNTGRSALEYILKVKKYRSIFVPYFTCEVIMEPIRRLGIPYQYYTIDYKMDPVLDFEPGPGECFLYTNYFGLKQERVNELSKRYSNLIIDNAQAFFSEPIANIDTFYSCRKFFGVPDGAYLQLNDPIRLKLDRDVSYERFGHLIKNIDIGIEEGYVDFARNDKLLSNSGIRRMSALSDAILSGVDYKYCKYRRNSNFLYLHDFLVKYNDYDFDASEINGPMCYPLLHFSDQLRTKLIEKKVYTPIYWPNVLKWTTKKMYEHYLTTHLVALPIDHRYTNSDMKRMLNIIKRLL